MSKQIQRDEKIYIAPEILGKYENDIPIAIDERHNNQTLDPRNMQHKIIIYEREVKGWFLEPASALLNQNDFVNSFIVLMVCMSYLEGVEQYKTGVDSNNGSQNCFVDSVERLYPGKFKKNELKKLYSKSRCGLFHNGMVKGGVVFNNTFEQAIDIENIGETIRINPRFLLNDIKNDFENYINELRTTGEDDRIKTLRENFDRMFTVL